MKTPGYNHRSAEGPQARLLAVRTNRHPHPHLDRVELARQHHLQVQEQSDGDVGEEVEAQQPLQAAPEAQSPHHPSVAGAGAEAALAWTADVGSGPAPAPRPRTPRPGLRLRPLEGYAGHSHWLATKPRRERLSPQSAPIGSSVYSVSRRRPADHFYWPPGAPRGTGAGLLARSVGQLARARRAH